MNSIDPAQCDQDTSLRWFFRRAFTLMELIIVLVILSTLAYASIPRVSNSLSNARAEAATRRIVADLAFARQCAVSTSTSQPVTFNVTANSYQFTGVADLNRPSQTYQVFLGQDPYNATIVSANFGGDAVLIFTGYGTPDSGGEVVLQVGDRRTTISVNADTGQASVR